MNKTLYIVDDHRMMLKGLKDYLEENTDWKVLMTCLTSSECLSALEAASAKSGSNCEATLPDIIIVDVQLINENGFALVQKITEKYPSIKCVMYSCTIRLATLCRQKRVALKDIFQKSRARKNLCDV